MPIIELRNLSKCYRSGNITVTALNKVNFKVGRGDFVCLAGPSGSGKSTLLHLAGILDSPTEGEVIINGQVTRDFSKTAAALFQVRQVGLLTVVG